MGRLLRELTNATYKAVPVIQEEQYKLAVEALHRIMECHDAAILGTDFDQSLALYQCNTIARETLETIRKIERGIQ